MTHCVKIISIVLVLLFVQGCRIIQVVPLGGSIQSDSGNFDCAAGQTCTIDLPGTAWQGDIFTAVPDAGYRFVGWSTAAPSTFCKGEIGTCAITPLPPSLTAYTIDAYLSPIFEEQNLLDLLPAATRGVFQLYPGAAGTLDTANSSTPWSQGPVQILQHYSAGMAITENAERLILGQLSSTPDQFLLLAQLASSDVDTLSIDASLNSPRNYQDYPLWKIGTTGLELARIDNTTLAIGAGAALEQALDSYVGIATNIEQGPLASYLGALDFGPAPRPNSFVYGLPALYNPVAAPGNGDASLSQAKAVNSVFSITDGTLSGPLNFFSDNAVSYSAKLQEQLAGYLTPNIVTFGNIASVNLGGLSVEDDIRPLLKTLILDMDGVDYADAVGPGGNAPWLNFQVGGDPNSIFINFEFLDASARATFENTYLPKNSAGDLLLHMEPISIVQGETPRYFLVLNLYQSSGKLVQGARAEWSVFVTDPDTGETRFLVVEALAESGSLDSFNWLTPPEDVTHVLDLDANTIESCVGVEDCTLETPVFSSTIDWPQSSGTPKFFDRQFVAANDYIFWRNGVADRGLYNSSVFSREGVLVDPAQFSFTNTSSWAIFVHADPVHALVYLNPLDIVISPWWNLDETYLDDIIGDQLDPPPFPARSDLVGLKNSFYPPLIKENAQEAIRGEGLALSTTTVATSVPTANYHFPMTLGDATALLTAVADGSGVHTPQAVKLFDSDVNAGLYVTLTVYGREGDSCGTRAEWVTYVAGADGPETLRLDTFASEPCLDPISLMTVATDVSQSHNQVSNTVDTQISSPFTQFEASVDLSATTGAQAGLDWLESGDRVCSVNNVCDEFYIDGQLLVVDAEVAETPAVTITMSTPWDSYINTAAVRAGVRLTPATQAMNPWRNMRSFAAPAPLP